MLLQILTHTPPWVFAVFMLLLWLGARQLVASRTSLARITLVPVVMAGLSLYGAASAFGERPLALAGWAIASAVALVLTLQRALPAGIRYDPASRRFSLPGSAMPLALMMGIFVTKYAVGVTLAMHPGLAHAQRFALPISLFYGAISGIFAGRALRLWKLALRSDAAKMAPTTSAAN